MASSIKNLIILLSNLLLISDATKFRCDYVYNPESRAWYKYHEIPATWNDARLMCTLEGAILASPSTTEIKEALKNSLVDTATSEIFTGLRATFSKGSFFTINGIPLEQIEHTWSPSEPNNINNKENCLAMIADGSLLDVDCDDSLPYICFRDIEEEINNCGTPDPGYNFDKRTEKCYKFHTVPRNFERAHFTCSAEGGYLAIINSQVEAIVLRELFSKHPPVTMIGSFWKDVAFIGFSNWGEGGDWRTIHGQTLKEAGYDRFSPGEPNNSTTGEYCGSIYRSAWLNDLWCENEYAFICEKATDFPTVCDNAIATPP